jgi:hypothetical protein
MKMVKTQVRQVLPTKIGWLTARGSLHLLQSRRMPHRVEAAFLYLTELSESLPLLTLYQHFFPTEFTASYARNDLNIRDEVYTPKEKEFLTLCHERLFPLNLDYYFELSRRHGDERLPGIDIVELGITYWEEDLEWLTYSWRMLCLLLGEFNFQIIEQGQTDLLPAVVTAPGGMQKLQKLVESVKPVTVRGAGYDEESITALEKLCRAVRGEMERRAANHPDATHRAVILQSARALGALPSALRMLFKDTGLIFLDISAEMPADGWRWTIEDVEYLAETYAQTASLLEEVEVLLEWLGDEQFALLNFQEVVKLWNSLTV